MLIPEARIEQNRAKGGNACSHLVAGPRTSILTLQLELAWDVFTVSTL